VLVLPSNVVLKCILNTSNSHNSSCRGSQTGHRSPLPWQRRKAIISTRNERSHWRRQTERHTYTHTHTHTQRERERA